MHLFETGDDHDVAGFGFLHFFATEASEAVELEHAALLRHAVRSTDDHHRLIRFDGTGEDAANAHTTDEVIVVDVGDLQLQRSVRLNRRAWDVFDDGVEQRTQIAVLRFQTGVALLQGVFHEALTAGTVHHREVELPIFGAEFDHQVEDAVGDDGGRAVGLIDLVDHQDHLEAGLDGFAQHETRLRQTAFEGVDQHERTVRHLEHALDLTAEVGVARRIDDVDADVAGGRAQIVDRAVLREDSNAAFFFLILRVHHAIDDGRLGVVGAALLEQRVDQRGLAMVDVRDDGDVTDVGTAFDVWERHGMTDRAEE